jgi:hypothetical protein
MDGTEEGYWFVGQGDDPRVNAHPGTRAVVLVTDDTDEVADCDDRYFLSQSPHQNRMFEGTPLFAVRVEGGDGPPIPEKGELVVLEATDDFCPCGQCGGTLWRRVEHV